MADISISSFPIAELLIALGARPGKRRNFWHSPFREDRDASLHIDPKMNLWYDHGVGIGGGNIDLVIQCRHCSSQEAADYIRSLTSAAPRIPPNAGRYSGSGMIRISHSAPNRIVRVQYLHSPYFLEYFQSRGIPARIAVRYCREVTLRGKTNNRTYDNIGFPNNAGGYALKAPSGFKSTTKGGVTTIDTNGIFTDRPSCGMVTVFEGFFDFLSSLAFNNTELPSTDVLVLNSVANLRRGLPYLGMHDSVFCCLDRDDAGFAALETLRSLRLEIGDPAILDCSDLYEGFKDYNAWWVAQNKQP